ncbi:MAG: histidinol-phosphate transaminase [Eubacteriales bacterium]|nr:histidinol-phosphate transaminase [Eubacteriales bacterium]
MSRWFSERFAALAPYTPGEQPQDRQYIKLNTNESPFPPPPAVAAAAAKEAGRLALYSDPECAALRNKMAALYGLAPENIMMTNGSDEALNLAFMAFADETRPLIFPDITYGFYRVFAQVNRIPFTEIPLRDDFSVDERDYLVRGRTIVLANPNAPTGLSLPLPAIERIAAYSRDNIVIVDEAYVDFGGESAVRLLERYDNLIVTGTFSKSRSLAGARLGFAFASPALIADMNTLRYSTNPYNVNRMTAAAGIAALENNDYFMNNCRLIRETREWTRRALEAERFTVLASEANFLFAADKRIPGKTLYEELKRRGVLIRHFDGPRIREYNRITIGTREQMEVFMTKIREILGGI